MGGSVVILFHLMKYRVVLGQGPSCPTNIIFNLIAEISWYFKPGFNMNIFV